MQRHGIFFDKILAITIVREKIRFLINLQLLSVHKKYVSCILLYMT